MEDFYRFQGVGNGGLNEFIEFQVRLGKFDKNGAEFCYGGSVEVTKKEWETILKAAPSLAKKIQSTIVYAQNKLEFDREESDRDLCSCGCYWQPCGRKKKV